MLELGLSLEIIQKSTELSEEEILSIKKGNEAVNSLPTKICNHMCSEPL